MAVVIVKRKNGELQVFGPFADGDQASRWGFANCSGFEWFWDYLTEVNIEEDARWPTCYRRHPESLGPATQGDRSGRN